MFLQVGGETTSLYLTAYVDDLILLVDVYEKRIKLKGELSSRFKMTDMGKLSYCLGICVVQGDRSPHVQLSVAPGTSQPCR